MSQTPTVSIAVPYVERKPDPQAEDYIPLLADHLLTALLRHDVGELHADYFDGSGEWRVRPGQAKGAQADEVVATTLKGPEFRMLLAHFGHHYMGTQLYGGFAEGRLTQNRREHLFAMYMANDPWRGFWLKAFVKML